MTTFAAIDFETANNSRDSACSVGIVIVSNGRIKKKISRLIKPPDSYFSERNISIHGIRWSDVENEKTFDKVWRDLRKYIKGIEFFVAHNAGFDKSVLNSCCKAYKISNLNKPFSCTMRIARSTWSIYPTKLPDVCNYLDIELNHHDALSDAEACAQIFIAAENLS